MPEYGSDQKLTLADVEEPKAKPGEARSKAGITRPSKKRRARS
jgi:hypothetical protein